MLLTRVPLRAPAWCGALLGLWLLPALATAQPVGLLIHGEPDASLVEKAAEVQQALGDRGLSVVASDGLTTLLRAAGFEPYQELPAWSDTLRQASAQALEDAAFGRFDRVRASADAQLVRAEGVLGWVGTEPELTTLLGDLCLHAVRAELRLELEGEARARAARCLRVVPAFSPSPAVHPESVIETLAQVRDELRRDGPLLELEQDAPIAGCELRLQGVHASDSSRRPAGAYVCSVSCSRAGGWVKRFELPGQGLRLDVPVTLLHGLATADGQLHVRARADAAKVAEALDAITHVRAWVVIDRGDGDRARLRHLVRQEDALQVRAEVAWQGSAQASVQALLAPAEPAGTPGPEPEPPTADEAAVARAPRAGWTLAAGAVALAGTAWGLYGGWRSRDATLRATSPALMGTSAADPAYLRLLDDRDRLGAWSSALTGVAGALALSAVPLLTRRPRPRKVWPWVVGAVGAGLAATGAWVLSRGNQSETLPDGRTRATPVVPLAPLLLSQGLSLLFAPVLSETGQQSRTSRAHFGISGYF